MAFVLNASSQVVLAQKPEPSGFLDNNIIKVKIHIVAQRSQVKQMPPDIFFKKVPAARA
jgi:hypothetical protein